MADLIRGAVVIVAFLAAFGWPPFFIFVLDKPVRQWLARRMNDRIYSSGRGRHWKTTSGRAVGHIQFALIFGPTLLLIALIVAVLVLLRAIG